MNGYSNGVELEDRPCPSGCSPADAFVLEGEDRIHGIPGRFKVVRCLTCDLIRTNPRPTPETIGVYYPENYGPYLSTSAPSSPRHVRATSRIGKLLCFEDKRLPDILPGRMLEIGCASGSYLAEMRSRGWDVEGIEFSETATRIARAKGISVQCATVESAANPDKPVDVVTAWMVLEHLHEPVRALSRIRSWVKPNGYLVASVPDAGGALGSIFGDARYDLHLPNHLYHFTPRTLRKLLNLSGWELERVYWQRTCNNHLWSLEYVATSRKWNKLASVVSWLRTSKNTGKLRTLLAWMLGATKQSGRIEIWARPK